MNYKKIHDQIIERAKNRVLDGYKETHHIIPRSLGGNNKKSNLIDLTLKEHYIIHLLLVKIYPKAPQLLYALWMMSNRNKNKNSAMYATTKEKYIILFKERLQSMLKEDPDYFRKNAGKCKGIRKKNTENYKGPKSEQTCKKMSDSAYKRPKVSCDICGKIVSKENLKNHKKAHTGEIKHTDEKKAKIAIGVKNIPRIPCELCDMTINPSNMWRHMKKHERKKINGLQCL